MPPLSAGQHSVELQRIIRGCRQQDPGRRLSARAVNEMLFSIMVKENQGNSLC